MTKTVDFARLSRALDRVAPPKTPAQAYSPAERAWFARPLTSGHTGGVK